LADTAAAWRIDQLAREAGLTVDTIRYYVRERLLPPPERSGRHKLYGPEHLERLARIRELQAQRFSLAAIRAVLDADRPGLEGLFTAGARREYTLAELVAGSGVDAGAVDGLRAVGLLPDPAEFGRQAYDDNDLDVLRAIAELQEIGMTTDLLVALGAIYVRHFRALQADVHDLFAGRTLPDRDEAEVVAVQRALTANTARMIPAVDRVLNYVHQRTIQRLTLEALQTAQETRTGVGGVRLDDADDADEA
jgi:DNA-binding transcriptional MerR regulator